MELAVILFFIVLWVVNRDDQTKKVNRQLEEQNQQLQQLIDEEDDRLYPIDCFIDYPNDNPFNYPID
ncbi:MAG: hypothetical protein V5B36_00810 [Candidatus Accumulibacter sp. UW25]|jgi:hypothetical protein